MINLEPFCLGEGDWVQRPGLQSPFRYGGHVYATDGRIILRLNGKEYPAIAQAKEPVPTLESINGLGWRHADVTQWTRFDDFWPKECAQCSGSGKHGCECGNKHDCVNCDGTGYRPKLSKYLTLGAARITREYALLIKTLPNVMIETPQNFDKPIVFKFEGGEGLAMGILKDQ